MSIFSLEKKMFTKNEEALKKELFELLDGIERGKIVLGGQKLSNEKQTSGIPPLDISASFFENQNSVQRIATVITAFLCSPSLTLNQSELYKLLLYKTHLTDIFYLSDFGSMDHILLYRDLWSPETGLTLKNDSDVLFLLVCWTINSQIRMPFDVLQSQVPQYLMLTLTAALYQFEQIQTERGFSNFREVYDQFLTLPENLDISICKVMLINIWMGCSYWDIPDRHAIKIKINRLIKASLPNLSTRRPGTINKNPKIAIMLERYRSEHAVYRCFHSHIAELKKNYQVCFFVNENDVDDISKKDAHHCVYVESNPKDLKKLANQVNDYRPDIIIYLSLGMNIWTVQLANFRLAPIQVMGYGHPASAFMETIDYGFLVGWLPGPDYQSMCKEKVIEFEIDLGNDIELHANTDLSIRSPSIKPSTESIKIAINSSLMKVSDRVLHACKLLRDNSDKSIEFHFFPAHQRAFKPLAFERKLFEIFGEGFTIHAPCAYSAYMEKLSRCHFAIGTFPFGGTNTNTDSVILGQPKLYLKSEGDLAELTDYCNFMRFDETGGFSFDSELELIATAIIWIHNPIEHEQAQRRVEKMRDRLLTMLSTTSSENRAWNLSYLHGIEKLTLGEIGQVQN
ncbi:hypothetical protein ACFQGA_08625 [Marinobacter koreensis]|uniref:HMW1C N-terminal domain-containing protein n=1 Tax=Marinobacter koreensis TaxID=335974 RepID=A0ABW0RI10_9GAMM